MSFLGLMTVRAHEAVVREWDLRCVEARDQRDNETIRANKLSADLNAAQAEVAHLRDDVRAVEGAYQMALEELATLKAERDAILRDKKREAARRTEAVAHSISLTRELAALRPDAQKWRDRKQADRDYRANKRRDG